MGAAVAWLGWEALAMHYGREAAKFDLDQLHEMEAASIILDRSGRQIGKIFIQNRDPVAYDQISKSMIEAVIAAEDNKFFKHKGVDWMGIARAAIANYRKGRISQGASTVTQQLARNSFDMRERTYKRKLLEIFLARRMEESLSKEEIMRLYLNRVYFGSGFYGVEAAARGYFGKSAKDLTPGESAMLAGLLKSPQALSPWNNKDAAREARDFVLRRMREQGFLNRKQLNEELEKPLVVTKRTNPFKVSYAIDLIRQQAIAALGFDRAMNGGFTIQSTLDDPMQKAAEKAVASTLAEIEARPGYNHETFAGFRNRVKAIEEQIQLGNMNIKMPTPRYLQAAVLALDSSSGAVLAMVGGREFLHSEYNRAVQARRPAGTAFTPFVFAAAYERGAFPGDIVEDACIDNRYVMVGGESGILGEWGVERADNEYEGPMPMREALAKGKNAATVRVGFSAGLDAVKSLSASAGIRSPLRDYANTYLGSSEVTLEELTLGYTAFGAAGMRPQETFLIAKITDADGGTVYEHQPKRVQAMKRETAYQVHSGLEDALRLGTGAVASEYGLGDFPAAGKTGTAYNFTDTYFVGYNSAVTCGVWVGFDRPTKIFRGAFGRDLALPVWTAVMNTAAKRFPAVKFIRPETLEEVEICRDSGLLATPNCRVQRYDPRSGANVDVPTTYTEYATKEQLPKIACDVHGPGIRSYVRRFEEGQWPRALDPVDVSRIRPVAVNAPTLLGLTDVYGSVRPGSKGATEDVPVARAVAVNQVQSIPPPLTIPTGTPFRPQNYIPAIPFIPTADGGSEPEVRRAAPTEGGSSAIEAPAIPVPTPAPIEF